MNNFHLPSDLERIERELIERSISQPVSELRQRITVAVRNHLRRERRQDFWRFAAAAAIIAAVWFNLSISAARETDFHLQLADGRQSVEQTVRQIRELLPEMPETDARREALLLCAGGNMAIYPRITALPAEMNQLLNSDKLLP